jgi:hypothetical protein
LDGSDGIAAPDSVWIKIIGNPVDIGFLKKFIGPPGIINRCIGDGSSGILVYRTPYSPLKPPIECSVIMGITGGEAQIPII